MKSVYVSHSFVFVFFLTSQAEGDKKNKQKKKDWCAFLDRKHFL